MYEIYYFVFYGGARLRIEAYTFAQAAEAAEMLGLHDGKGRLDPTPIHPENT